MVYAINEMGWLQAMAECDAGQELLTVKVFSGDNPYISALAPSAGLDAYQCRPGRTAKAIILFVTNVLREESAAAPFF